MTQLSVLDLSPIPQGADAARALRNSRDLAGHAERLGYRRYWLAEHHNMPGIASSDWCWRPSKRTASQTSSQMAIRSCVMHRSASIKSSAAEATLPLGFSGSLTIMARVRGVISASISDRS